MPASKLYLIEIPHQTTTPGAYLFEQVALYLIEIPHQTTTYSPRDGLPWRCILSKFHIKPQLISSIIAALAVVSYRNSTSNHNCSHAARPVWTLYLIEIPHQTTTTRSFFTTLPGCILSKFHIKPQPPEIYHEQCASCILSKFHIKPQLRLSIGF